MRLFTLLVAACGACGASAACDGFGFARNTAATFDVFYWLQVANFDVLFDSAPSRSNYIDVWDLCIHAPNGLLGLLIGFYHAFAFAAIATLTARCGTRSESTIDFRYVSAPDANLHLQNQLEFAGGSGSLCLLDEGAFDHSRKPMPEV